MDTVTSVVLCDPGDTSPEVRTIARGSWLVTRVGLARRTRSTSGCSTAGARSTSSHCSRSPAPTPSSTARPRGAWSSRRHHWATPLTWRASTCTRRKWVSSSLDVRRPRLLRVPRRRGPRPVDHVFDPQRYNVAANTSKEIFRFAASFPDRLDVGRDRGLPSRRSLPEAST
jgi:hypothetical protein